MTRPKGIGLRVGGEDGWGGEPWWGENGDNCTRTRIKQKTTKKKEQKNGIIWLQLDGLYFERIVCCAVKDRKPRLFSATHSSCDFVQVIA